MVHVSGGMRYGEQRCVTEKRCPCRRSLAEKCIREMGPLASSTCIAVYDDMQHEEEQSRNA